MMITDLVSSLNLVTGKDSIELTAEDAAMDGLVVAMDGLAVKAVGDNSDVLWCTACGGLCVCGYGS